MKKRICALILGLLMVCVSCALAEGGAVPEETMISRTTGLPVANRPYKALAVQFDNTADARPQLNMSRADVIYEMEIHNGGYTRYTAIYSDDIPEMVEAVRSARIMHVDVSMDWSASFVHFGKQTGGVETNVETYVAAVGIERFDGMKDAKRFYRDSDRVAPYNVVARLNQVYEAATAPDAETVHTPLSFSADNPTIKGDNVSVFRIPYGEHIGFYPSYEYIKEEGVYRRFYNRRNMVDGASGRTYDFANVIVMYADYEWHNGADDQPIVALTGTNKCEYFIGGKHFTGTWMRESVYQSTVYYDDEGKVVQFKPGKTFIQVVKPSVKIEIVK